MNFNSNFLSFFFFPFISSCFIVLLEDFDYLRGLSFSHPGEHCDTETGWCFVSRNFKGVKSTNAVAGVEDGDWRSRGSDPCKKLPSSGWRFLLVLRSGASGLRAAQRVLICPG